MTNIINITKISPIPKLPIKPNGTTVQSLLKKQIIIIWFNLPVPIGRIYKKSVGTIVYHCSEALDCPSYNNKQ